jgi:hypothetical protein
MRREFPRRIRAAIILRATNAAGLVTCEGCGLVLGRKPFQVDHTLPEALVVDKGRPLTAADGKLLGQECCHAPKTRVDLGMIRKADRQRDKHTGASAKPSRIRSRGFEKPPAQRRASSPLAKKLPPRRYYGE